MSKAIQASFLDEMEKLSGADYDSPPPPPAGPEDRLRGAGYGFIRGNLAGGGIGGIVGGILGGIKKDPEGGAALGALLGSGAGALVGSYKGAKAGGQAAKREGQAIRRKTPGKEKLGGLPSAVRKGGGGTYGVMRRTQHARGRRAAYWLRRSGKGGSGADDSLDFGLRGMHSGKEAKADLGKYEIYKKKFNDRS
jgi:hypothetical protein